jgi:aryl-alcohol dehydrogenase-like predicted oxidoreductase
VNYRRFGKTNLLVSEIGYGAWGIGGGLWQGSNDEQSMKALHRAIDLGINFIDTALAYGQGHSERLVGQVVKQRREAIYVATKIPPRNRRWPAHKGTPLRETFPAQYIRECTESSLRNLKVDVIDLQQFHVWDDEWTDDAEWYDMICTLKEEGKIRFFGVSVNDHEPQNAIRITDSGKIETVQVIYNIFDQSPAEQLLPLCLEREVGVIVRVPFDEGGLTGQITPETSFPEGDFRARYFRGERKVQVYERAKRLEQLLGKEAATLPELALRFCLSHNAVSTVIPGMRTLEHVEMNVAVSNGRGLSKELLDELKNHQWLRNFYH